MSESSDQEVRGAARAANMGSGNHHRNFTIVAHGDGVVMVDTTNGRSWTLLDADGKPTWYPVDFAGAAKRAPRGPGIDDQA